MDAHETPCSDCQEPDAHRLKHLGVSAQVARVLCVTVCWRLLVQVLHYSEAVDEKDAAAADGTAGQAVEGNGQPEAKKIK